MPLEGIPLREEKREMTEAICTIRTSHAKKVPAARVWAGGPFGSVVGLAAARIAAAAQALLGDYGTVALGLQGQPQAALAAQLEQELVPEQGTDLESADVPRGPNGQLLDVGHRKADNVLNLLLFFQKNL